MLGIVDYAAGNQTSVARALKSLGIDCVISDSPKQLLACDGIIFPGVGAAGQAMNALAGAGLDQALAEAVSIGRPLLGICLGCQIMLEHSEENDTPLLGLLPGKCVRFPENLRNADDSRACVPHMGWNSLEQKRPCRLLEGISADAQFYFVHGYHVLTEPSLVLASSTHGVEFCAIHGRDGLWGVQFHPEKSGRPGLALLANFSAYCREKGSC